MTNYHDAVIRRMAVTMIPGRWEASLDLKIGANEVNVSFESVWWVGVHGLGMVAHEEHVSSIGETNWSHVPASCRYEAGGHKVFEVQCASGSMILVVARRLVERSHGEARV